MTDWSALNVIRDVLINYYFGDVVLYYSSIVLFFLLVLIVAGLDARMAVIFSLPLVAAFSLAGVFGSTTWVMPVILTIIAIIYAYAIIDLFT